jgi:hypothetical protein
MGKVSVAPKHKSTAGLSPTPALPYTAWNEGHGFANGLLAAGYFVGYDDAEPENVCLHNDGGFLINAPGRYALIASSSAIANTTAASFFSKFATIQGTALSALNIAGSVLRVTASGHMGTKASSPGVVTNAGIFLNGSTDVIQGASATLPGGLGFGAWRLVGEATVRSVGASGVLAIGGEIAYPGALSTAILSGATVTVDLTSNISVSAAWQWGTADPDNSATLTQLIVEIFLPGTTVS